MLPETFKAERDQVFWLEWPSGAQQKIHYVGFATYEDVELSERVDAMHFFFFEDRSARFVIDSIEQDAEDTLSFTVRRLPGREEVGVVTVRAA